MILTGKAKEDFKKWFIEEKDLYDSYENELRLMSDTCLNALIIEFFDSVGIYIEVSVNQITDKKTNKDHCNFDVAIFHLHHRTKEGRTLTQLNINVSRQKATQQAIIKANEIYNNRI